MTVYVQSTLDLTLYTPAAILGVVVLSPLMLGICLLLTPEYVHWLIIILDCRGG